MLHFSRWYGSCVSKLLICTSSRYRATLSFIWSCVCVHLMNVKSNIYSSFGSVLVSTNSDKYVALNLLNTSQCSPAIGWLCLSAVWWSASSIQPVFSPENSCLLSTETTLMRAVRGNQNSKGVGHKTKTMSEKMLKRLEELKSWRAESGDNSFFTISDPFHVSHDHLIYC